MRSPAAGWTSACPCAAVTSSHSSPVPSMRWPISCSRGSPSWRRNAGACATRSPASVRRSRRRTTSRQLLRVIVEGAVEATGARGARLLVEDGTIVETGDPDADGELLEFPLTASRTAFGTLTIVGERFDQEQRMAANSLASHATIALENARLHRIVERQALVDGLTGIANRRQCEDALASEIAPADRLGTPLTLVLADLDDFKAVNDIHGHAVGDDVLREFATVLKTTLRDSDLAGRWGGEEFLLLLPGTDAEGGANLAERVREGLAERSFLGRDGEVVTVTCSFGVAQLSAGATTASSSRPPTRASTGQNGKGRTGSRSKQPSGAFSSLDS